ncbi:MAG: MarR family transcriptional regulator [Clostridia bacterium]|nr:MarR family transcriptional regulator [Clostridia bacterium]
MNDQKTTCGEAGCCERFSPTPPMLVNEIARLFHARMRSYETDSMMTQDSVRLILRELGHCDGCSQLDLVHKTHLKPPTVSVTLTKLEDEGLVVRRRDEMDQRVIRVFLSQKGLEHHRLVHERLHTVDQALMQGFDEEETEQLLQFLVRMRNNILPEKADLNPLESSAKLSKNKP